MSQTPTRRVVSLTYSHTMKNENRRFVDGFRQVTHLGDFHCVIDDEKIFAMPTSEMATVEEARALLEPYLAAWELRSELLMNTPLTFKKRGDLVRDENHGQVVSVGIVEEVEILSEVIAVLTTSRLTIPTGPALTPGEETVRLRERWRDVATGKERLLVGAYWVLTEIERYFGSRQDAATNLAVSDKALKRLGALASRNDPEHGRKARSPLNPLSSEEITWVRALIPLLVVRVAEVESGLDDLHIITMADLPPLAHSQ